MFEYVPILKDTLLQDLPERIYEQIKKDFRPRIDGHWEHRGPIRLRWAFKWGTWRSWFTSHRIMTGQIQARGLKGEGCCQGFLWTYSRVYHFGPLKVVFGPSDAERELLKFAPSPAPVTSSGPA